MISSVVEHSKLPSHLHCYKMHGLGNDYIYMFERDVPPNISMSQLAIAVSDRHRGVGSDGLVTIGKATDADFSMRIWNIDGSEAQMCGNASRCVALLVHIVGLTNQDTLTLSTRAGIKVLQINRDENGLFSSVTVDMGIPTWEDPFDILTPHGPLQFIPVDMGNPHGVTFIDKAPDDSLVLNCGPVMEAHPHWPEKANIEFAHIINRSNIRMRVWERGSGETLACGTGACATAVAAILSGRSERKVNVHLPGGTLTIEWRPNDSHVLMSGSATPVAEINYFLDRKSVV